MPLFSKIAPRLQEISRVIASPVCSQLKPVFEGHEKVYLSTVAAAADAPCMASLSAADKILVCTVSCHVIVGKGNQATHQVSQCGMHLHLALEAEATCSAGLSTIERSTSSCPFAGFRRNSTWRAYSGHATDICWRVKKKEHLRDSFAMT